MLIDLLRNDAVISQYFCNECAENDVSIEIDSSIAADDMLIIKVDNYYNKSVPHPPESPDCLIVQRCSENTFLIYIVELKNISSPKYFKVENIRQKFITCLDDFMSNRFAKYFHQDKITYSNIRLIFISDPYNFKNVPVRQEKMTGYKLDTLLAQRIPKYFGLHLYIDHKLPNPKINNCRTIEA